MTDEVQITSLDGVLGGEAPVVAEVEPTVEPEVEPVEKVEASAEPVEETPEAAPTAEVPKEDDVSAFKKAMLDERGKRQELEKQLEALKTPEVKPDAYAEPEEALNYGLTSLESKVENRFLNMSEYNANKRHEDFEAMKELFFSEMVVKNPSLQAEAQAHPDPYEFIYETAQTHNEFKDVSNLGDWKAKTEAEIREKLEAEYAEKEKAKVEEAINNAIPKSLSSATAAGGTGSKGFSGQTPLDKIIGQK